MPSGNEAAYIRFTVYKCLCQTNSNEMSNKHVYSKGPACVCAMAVPEADDLIRCRFRASTQHFAKIFVLALLVSHFDRLTRNLCRPRLAGTAISNHTIDREIDVLPCQRAKFHCTCLSSGGVSSACFDTRPRANYNEH